MNLKCSNMSQRSSNIALSRSLQPSKTQEKHMFFLHFAFPYFLAFLAFADRFETSFVLILGPLGVSKAHLGRLSGLHWAYLGLIWAVSKASWDHFGPPWSHPSPPRAHLESILAICASPGATLGSSRLHFGTFWGPPGSFWGRPLPHFS